MGRAKPSPAIQVTPKIQPLTVFWFLLGILLVLAGLQGDFGSMLAALLAPGVLEEKPNG